MKRERNKEKDLEGTKQGSVTRVLADEENFYYDKIDLFPYAQEGMTRGEWMCGLNRTLQVGERVFFLHHSYRVWNDRVNIHQLSSEWASRTISEERNWEASVCVVQPPLDSPLGAWNVCASDSSPKRRGRLVSTGDESLLVHL